MMFWLAQTTQPGGMRSWTAEEWGVFLGALAVFLTALGGVIAKIFVAISNLRRQTADNSKALVPLIEANKADPNSPDVNPQVEAAVRDTATGKGSQTPAG